MTKPVFKATLACGCSIGFREGVEGSPVTVVVQRKASTCVTASHVAEMPIYDHREALRPSTRHLPPPQADWEES